MARFFLINHGFELGDRDWQKGTDWVISKDVATARTGAWRAIFTGTTPGSLRSLPDVPMRPGGKITMSGWFDGSAATGGGTGRIQIIWIDNGGLTIGSSVFSAGVAQGQVGYIKESLTDTVAPGRAKFVRLQFRISDTPDGTTWLADDAEASGDIIETIPTSAIIREKRITPADTVSAFDPLVGETKFSEFNAGMSDRWSGVYTFIPALGADLGELAAFIQRIGKRDRFFADDPDHQTPVNGVVNGMVVDGVVNGGNTRIPVRNGPVGTTALVFGDYVEIRAQYFKVMRALEIGPEGTGDLIVWPSVRAALADGEDLITDHPKLVARRTSEFDLRRFEAHPEGPISMSWIEY